MDLSHPLPVGGVKVPIYATFTGVRGVPLLALGTNSFSPLLQLHEDRLEFKVIRRHTKPYSQIEAIDIFQMKLTNNIEFIWKGERFTLSANVIRADWLGQVVQFFERKSIALTPRARALLELKSGDGR